MTNDRFMPIDDPELLAGVNGSGSNQSDARAGLGHRVDLALNVLPFDDEAGRLHCSNRSWAARSRRGPRSIRLSLQTDGLHLDLAERVHQPGT